MMTRSLVACAALIGVLAGCRSDAGPPDDQATGSIDSTAWQKARALPAGVAAALDSGNVAFRAGDFEEARAQYLQATELGPEVSAAWFGLSMSERQLGNAAAADSAMLRVQQLAPGASLLHPGNDTSR
jgi:Flp pilus assembly protein TadD